MDRYLHDATVSDLGQMGEAEAGNLQPDKHMLQLWRQEVLTAEQPAYVVLYHNGTKWRQVPRAVVRRAARQLLADSTSARRDLAPNIHEVIHMAMQITSGAAALLKAIDDELTATGL